MTQSELVRTIQLQGIGGITGVAGTALPVVKCTTPVENDPINHPTHYISPTGLEVVDVMEAFAPTNPWRAQAIKYLLRAGHKGDAATDLAKCGWWIERELRWLQRERPNE